jgi:hypothetical protein
VVPENYSDWGGGEAEGEGVGLVVEVFVGDAVLVPVPLGVPDGVALDVAEIVGVPLLEGVPLPEGVPLGEFEPVFVAVGVPVPLGVAVGEGEKLPVSDGVALVVDVIEGVGEGEGVEGGVPPNVDEGEGVGEGEKLPVSDGVALIVDEVESVGEGEGVPLGVTARRGTVGEGDGDAKRTASILRLSKEAEPEPNAPRPSRRMQTFGSFRIAAGRASLANVQALALTAVSCDVATNEEMSAQRAGDVD